MRSKRKTQETLSVQEIGLFLDIAHNDGVVANRFTAIEILTFLPLSDDAWKETAFAAIRLLREIFESGRYLESAVRVFARIPVRSIREILHKIAGDPGHPQSFMCAVELAQRGDAAGVERLLDELEGANAAGSAERLACLPIENLGVTRGPFAKALSHDDPMARFWAAVALARLGEVERLEKVCEALLSGKGEVPPFFHGDPWTPYSALSAARPLPDKLRRHLVWIYDRALKKVRAESRPDAKLPRDASILIGGLTGIVDVYGEPVAGAKETPPKYPKPVDQAKADAVAQRLLERPFDEQLTVNVDWEDMPLLSSIGPEKAGQLMMAALDDLEKKTRDRPAETTPLDEIMFGNAMLDLASALPEPVKLPLSEIAESYYRRWPNLPKGPLTWVLSRAGAGALVGELGPLIVAAPDFPAEVGGAASSSGPPEKYELLPWTRNIAANLNAPAPFAGAGPGGGGEHVSAEALIIDDEVRVAMTAEPGGLEEAAPPEEEAKSGQDPRYIQKRMKRLDGGPGADDPPALVGGVRHLMGVRIGPPEKGWDSPKNLVPFPYELLPPAKEHRLRVVLSEPDHLEEPLVNEVVLPRSGPSSEAEFKLTPRAGLRAFRARIVVSHRNRILQTALLTGRVVADIKDAGPDDRIEFEVAVVRPTLHDLEGRTAYNLALAVNHEADGEPRLLTLSDEHAVIRGLTQVQGKINAISACLSMIAQNAKAYSKGLKSPEAIMMLNVLADKGRALYDFLVRDQLVDRYRAEGPIQIVNLTPDAYFPAEFIYDFATPKEDAGLCKKAKKAFEKLDFSSICTGKDHESPEYPVVCPFGFWGLKRVIERHACLPKGSEKIAGDFVLQAEPAEGRGSVELMGNTMLGVSSRVDEERAGEVKALFKKIKKISPIPVSLVPDWQNWPKQVESLGPSLIVSLPHAEEITHFEDTEYYLEIGGELKKARLIGETAAHYVLPHEKAPAPVVLLLGCNTTVPRTPIESIVGHFRRAGAAIVVSTVSSVLGSHASKVAEQLVDAMFRETSESPRSVGELLRDVRRRCLGKGTLIALCVVAFGDADWQVHTAKNGGSDV